MASCGPCRCSLTTTARRCQADNAHPALCLVSSSIAFGNDGTYVPAAGWAPGWATCRAAKCGSRCGSSIRFRGRIAMQQCCSGVGSSSFISSMPLSTTYLFYSGRVLLQFIAAATLAASFPIDSFTARCHADADVERCTWSTPWRQSTPLLHQQQPCNVNEVHPSIASQYPGCHERVYLRQRSALALECAV
jgi:hypothetical protein